MDSIIGPFTTTSILPVSVQAIDDPEKIIQDFQQYLWTDLDHSSVSGISVLRELKKQKKVSSILTLPIVFTSELNTLKQSENKGDAKFLDNMSYKISQTPQVYLDHQVAELDGDLVYTWDVVEAYFGGDNIHSLFAKYARVLQAFSNASDVWNAEILDSMTVEDAVDGETRYENRQDYLDSKQSSGPVLVVRPEEKYEPFPLTDQQLAYAFGRTKHARGGGNNCSVYIEFNADQVDIAVLEASWAELMKRHEMLVCKVFSNGNQCFLRDIPKYTIALEDFSQEPKREITRQLNRNKKNMLDKIFELDSWPFFDLRVSKIDASQSRIHLCIDMIIADVNSIFNIIRELVLCYESKLATGELDATFGHDALGGYNLNETGLEVTFRDYVLSLQGYKSTPAFKNSLHYWQNKLLTIPSGPQLPLIQNRDTVESKNRGTLKASLMNWNALEVMAQKIRVNPSTILLTAYAEVLSSWSPSRRFTIAIPCWHRLSVHPHVEEIVGDFTSMSWLIVTNNDKSFTQKVREYHDLVQQDLSHSAVSGLKALRKIMIGRGSDAPKFTVVFTDPAKPQSKLNTKRIEFLSLSSKTPDVNIDLSSAVSDNQLDYQWDVQFDVYPDGMIEAMFSGYTQVLQALASRSDDWDTINIVGLIAADPERYEQPTEILTTIK